MEWTSMEPLGALFILGDFNGEIHTPADDCEDVLEDMLDSLDNDDHRTGTFRRRIGLEKVLQKDLIPLLKSTNDEKIFCLAIQFMAKLTQPLEVNPQDPSNGDVLREMDNLLTEVKHLCTDVNFFKTMSCNIKKLLSKTILEDRDRQCLNYCVLFLRNLLHMRHGTVNDEHTFIAHQCLLSSFFMNELDKVIVNMIQHKDKEYWTIGIAQLISFIFKDYSGSLLEPELDDNTSNMSGEENQNMVEILLFEGHSNNRHPTSTAISTTRTLTNNFKRNLQICSTISGGSSSSLIEDDDFMLEIKSTQDGRLEIKLTNPTLTLEGDSGGNSDRGGSPVEDVAGAKGLSGELSSGVCDSQTCGISKKNLSPCGSTSSQNSISNSNGKSHDNSASRAGAGGSRTSPVGNANTEDVMPTMNSSSCLMDMDIFIAYLKKFATDIVYTGLVELVENMMKALLTKYESVLDHSLLFWTVGFFLSFSQQHELKLERIKEILNLDLFGFVVYEGVKTCESLVLGRQRQADCAVERHRLHLVVCTLNQMFRTLLANNKTKPVCEYLHRLQKYLSGMSDLRNLFVLLIRLHSSDQSQTHLCDLVQTNHVLMMMIEEWLATGLLQENQNFSLLSHVNQFATCKVMAKYGSLLEQEDGNRETLNIAVLTMMYHVAGSCQRHDTLVQLPILKVFTEIWMENAVREESKLRASAKSTLASSSLYEHEFKDLIEFVLKVFMNNADKGNGAFVERLFANAGSSASQETSSLESMNTDSGLFSKDLGEEEQVLIVPWMVELSGREDAVSVITRRLRDHGFDQNSEQVRKYLEENGFMLRRQVAESPNPSDDSSQLEEVASGSEIGDKFQKVLQELSMIPEEAMIPWLVGKAKEEGNEAHLVWLQKQFMEIAYVKLGLQDPTMRVHVEEPVSRFYAIQNKSIPLVPWNEELEQALATPCFLFLQRCLGLYTNEDPNILYTRVPQYLTPSMLVDMASRIGPIASLNFTKFDVKSLKDEYTIPGAVDSGTLPDSTTGGMEPSGRLSPSRLGYQWLDVIQTMNQVAS